MIFLFLPYIVQILLILHALRNGKNFTWIWLLAVLPYVGGLLYLFLEIIPDMRRGRLVSGEQVALWINRNARLKKLEEEVKISDTVANNIALGDEHFRLGNFKQAAEIYQGQLKGIYKDDASLLLKLAKSAFFARDYVLARDSFDQVKAPAAMAATDTKAYWFFARYAVEKTDERLGELRTLFEVTKSSEVGRYLCMAYELTGDAAAIRGVLELSRLQLKRLTSGARAAASGHLKAMQESLARVSAQAK